MYQYVTSLCCTPETYVTLCINCTQIKKKFKTNPKDKKNEMAPSLVLWCCLAFLSLRKQWCALGENPCVTETPFRQQVVLMTTTSMLINQPYALNDLPVNWNTRCINWLTRTLPLNRKLGISIGWQQCCDLPESNPVFMVYRTIMNNENLVYVHLQATPHQQPP